MMSRLEEEKARTAILRSRVIELEDDLATAETAVTEQEAALLAELEAVETRLKALREAGARPNEHDEDGHEYVPVQRFAALLSAAKIWKQATESRVRLISPREMSDRLLPADKALFEAIEAAQSGTEGVEG